MRLKTQGEVKHSLAGFGNRGLAIILWGVSLFYLLVMMAALFHGFPFLEGTFLRAKSLRKYFEFAFAFLLLGILVHPRRDGLLSALKTQAERVAEAPSTIWILSGVYFLLFFWVNVTRYFSQEINFIPFLFYDYMLWYFERGQWCYTGLLHGYYHVNLILLALYPLWRVFHTPWLLHVAGPLIVALAAVPFYFWSRSQFKRALPALASAFIFLNFRFVKNLLDSNFAVEAFYPLLIFSAVWLASKKKNVLYYLILLSGLSVKEDSAVYFGILGLFFLGTPSQRGRGLATLMLSGLYLVFILKVFLPWSGSDILEGDLNNFREFGTGVGSVVGNVIQRPWLFVRELFIPLEKVRTLFKITSRLLFLPFLSPWFFLVVVSLYPVYLRGDKQFIQLAFYYGAAVLPFLFLAFVDGWRRWIEKPFFFLAFAEAWRRRVLKLFSRHSSFWSGGVLVGLILFNGMNLRPEHFTREDLKTIRLAQGIPSDKILVTQGHLLPYVGYREWNGYFTERHERGGPTQETYRNADYYLFDFETNPYPMSLEELRAKAEAIKRDPRWKMTHEDNRRLLFEKQ